MEPLSSFAISIAAGIALNLWSKFRKGVDKEINAAFIQSLKDWSPNTYIRKKFKNTLLIKLKKVHENPDLMVSEIDGDNDIKSFYKIYDYRLT